MLRFIVVDGYHRDRAFTYGPDMSVLLQQYEDHTCNGDDSGEWVTVKLSVSDSQRARHDAWLSVVCNTGLPVSKEY